MTNRDLPRWLIVWQYVAACSIAFTLISRFAAPSLGHPRPEGEWTYRLREPRSRMTYYVTPTVGMIHRAAPPVAFSIMGSFLLAAWLVERRRKPPSERATVETIASSPFAALVTYLVGLCVCFVPFAAGLTVRAVLMAVAAWTVYWISTIVVMRRRRRRRRE